MIISHGRRYIFVHIPKTGGTSLALALEARAMKDDLMLGDTPKARRRRRRLKGVETAGRLWKHSRIREIDGLVTQAEVEDYFTFTLVRNPWNRMVSYYHWLREQRFDHPAVRLAQRLEFAEFLAHPATISSLSAAPYTSYMRDAQGAERADLYIRLEHLDEDLVPLETHLGFGLRPLGHENRSQRQQDYRHYYSPASAALVAEMSAEDISRFGYRFDSG